ncbi:MAG TPA: hypothetical protein VF538_08470 [Pyrinomonadaceae bacterium]|jgi:hypothetical protein
MGDKKCAACGSARAEGTEVCPDCGGVGRAGGGDETDRGVAANLSARGPEELAGRDGADSPGVWKGAGAGMLTAVAFGLGGFLMMHDHTGSMGGVLFVLLPAAAGFAAAAVAPRAKLAAASILVALGICLGTLLVTRAEGVVCVVTASPLILVGVFIGAIFGNLFREQVIRKSNSPRTFEASVLVLAPLLLLGADAAERPFRRVVREETFVTSVALDAPPAAVWEKIKNVESLSGDKPFLLKIGLPVPVSCRTEGEGVGRKRTCYFDDGYIEERVTEWQPPSSMKLDITESTLPGRHWLKFRNASYELRREADGRTLLVRQTTITSRLHPAWYWRPLENMGVQAEHGYLFADLAARFAKK